VLENPTAHPLLLKEMNSSLNTQVKLTETSLKAITMLNEALVAADQAGTGDLIQEEHLTREQILVEMSKIKLDPLQLQAHLDGSPNIHPMGDAKRKRAELHPGTDSYVKQKDTIPAVALVEAVVTAR
jgi:hypothetical protein